MALTYWNEAIDEPKSINKRQPASIANIIQSQGVLSMNDTPLAPPNSGVFNPPCTAIYY